MNHVEEDELVLHHYGEAADAEAIERHLAGCDRCRAAYGMLRRTLEAVDLLPVPERTERYPAVVWSRVDPAAAGRRRMGWSLGTGLPRLALAASAVIILLGAFLFGRAVGVNEGELGVSPIPESVRERILLVAVGNHLERSQRLLIELVNADSADDVDLRLARPLARALAADNRVYRRSAANAGQESIAGLLDELERVLIELANGPNRLGPTELADLRKRVEGRGLLVKIRVLGDDARERGRRNPAGSPADRSRSHT
jgi:hypothetical protein